MKNQSYLRSLELVNDNHNGVRSLKAWGVHGDSSLMDAEMAIMRQDQIRKGIIISVCFVILRLIVARLWFVWFGMEYHLTLPFLIFLSISFVVISIGLIYFGFTKWVGINLKTWWVKPGQIGGDIKWGIVALFLGGIAFLAMAFGLYFLNLIPSELMVATGDNVLGGQSLAQIPINLLLGWFFGFTIAAFCEETVFRGFLVGVLTEKTNPRLANLIQAILFSISHIGMMPLAPIGNAVLAIVFRVVSGWVFGWLVQKRGTLLSSGIVHGFIG